METLLFPDTRLSKNRLYPLLLLCNPLHFLQIAEVDLLSPENNDPSLVEQSFCKVHTPAPFGDKLELYLELSKRIKTYKEQSAVAGTETGADTGMEGISSLLQKGAAELATGEFDAELRQAQLILALAEMLDNEEESLREEVFFLDEDEIARNLVNDLEAVKTQLQTPRPESTALRFAAWLHLFRQFDITPGIKLWMASSRKAGEEIFKRYSSGAGKDAVPILKLALPSYFRESPQYIVQHIEKFHKSSAKIHQGLIADFERITTSSHYERGSLEFLLPYHTDWGGFWEAALDDSFPAGIYGRSTVTFYLLPEQLLPGLLSPAGSEHRGADGQYHGLLGVLENETVS
ncbi:hypothetical protein [Desulfopila inferna]|uniref:hypothetical protein n=1 Tax=Desulfopila inferna TaxID=468528 RepID=UPI00196604C3|nr:hypothetical protein [Desulfopila inferna]MBM9605637.1 hypothetical protein [Desulfopila inferna]